MTAAPTNINESTNQQIMNEENYFLFQSLLYETARGYNETNNNDQGIIHLNTNDIATNQEYDDNNDHYVDLGDMEFGYKMISSEPIPKLNCMNIMNVLSYLWNLCVAIIIGYFGLFRILYTSQEVAYGQYQSVITPSVYTCYIWILIFAMEGIFSLLQLLHPKYRGNNGNGIGIMFFYCNIAQSLLIITYSFQYFFLSFILNVYLLVFLNSIFIEQSSSSSQNSSSSTSRRSILLDWFVLELPFQLKYAWVLYCTFCVVFMQSLVAHSESITTQLTSSVLCFVILTSVAISFLMPYSIFGMTSSSNILSNKPNYIIPLVIIWSFIGTYVELQNPNDAIQTFFGDDIILSIQYSTIGCCIIITCFGILRVLFVYFIRRSP